MVEQESLKQLIDPLFRFGDMQNRLVEIMLRRCFIYESPILIQKIMSNMNKHELDCLLYNFKSNISSVFETIYNPNINKRSRKNWLRVVILFVKKFDLSLPAHHELILHILKVSTYPDSKRNKNYPEVEFNERLNWILLMKIFRRISSNRILMQKIYTTFEFRKQDIDEVTSYAFSDENFTTVAHLRLVLLVSLLYQLNHGTVASPPKFLHTTFQKFPTIITQQQQVQSLMNISQQLMSQPSQTAFNHQSSLTQHFLLNQNAHNQNTNTNNPQTPPPQLQHQISLSTPQYFQNIGQITPSSNANTSNITAINNVNTNTNTNTNNNNNNWIITGNTNGKQSENMSCHSLLNNQSFAFNINQNQNQSPQQIGIKHQNTFNGTTIGNCNQTTNMCGNNKQVYQGENFTLQKNPVRDICVKDKRIVENFLSKSILLRCDRQSPNHYDWMYSSEWFLVQYWMSQLCSSEDLMKKNVALSVTLNQDGFKWTQKILHQLVQEIHEFLFLNKFQIYNENFAELLKKVMLSFLFEQQQSHSSMAQIPSSDQFSNASLSAIPSQPTLQTNNISVGGGLSPSTTSSSSYSSHQLRQDIKKILKSFRAILSVDLSKLPESLFTTFLSYDWRSNTVRPSNEIPLYDPAIFYKDQAKNRIISQLESQYFQQINSINNNSNINSNAQLFDFLGGNMRILPTVSLILEHLFSIDFINTLSNKTLIQQQFILPLMRTVSLVLQYTPIKNQITFHESVDKLLGIVDATNVISNSIKKQIQFKLQRIKRTRKEESLLQNMQNMMQNEQINEQVIQEESQLGGGDQTLPSYSQVLQQRSNSKNSLNQQNQQTSQQQNQQVLSQQINNSSSKNVNNVNSSTNSQQQDRVKQIQLQILEDFKKRQLSFSTKNPSKEEKKNEKQIKQNEVIVKEQEQLVCNICSESFIKRRIFYINCYIQLDNYYKSYQGFKKDIKQQHNYYLTTCNHSMHKDCSIQHIRTSNLYESLLQENEFFCQCCFRLSNIFVPYLEQYERSVNFKYNPFKTIIFQEESVHSASAHESEESCDEEEGDENQQKHQVGNYGIITSQLPKNPHLPLSLKQKGSKYSSKKNYSTDKKKKSHAINYFNFPKNSEDQSFLQVNQQIEQAGDKNGFGNENSPQKLLEKNIDFQRIEKAYREQQERELNLCKNKNMNLHDRNKQKKQKTDEVVEVSEEDMPIQAAPYLIKKKGIQHLVKGSKKKYITKKQKEAKKKQPPNSTEGYSEMYQYFGQNEQERLVRLLNQMQQVQYNEEIIVEERKESSIQEEERILTDYFEPEVDISYLEDMHLRLQHVDIKYNNILICFQSLLINQIEESISNSSDIQDFNILKESFATSKQFNVSRNLFLYLKVWSFIEDRDSIHENYFSAQRDLIHDIQEDDFFIYQVALGKKSNFAAVLTNLAILLLNKEEAFLSLSAKFIFKYIIFDTIIGQTKTLKDLDIIIEPQNFIKSMNEIFVNRFRDVVDYRFIQIAYCIWLVYFGKKNDANVNNFIGSMLSQNMQSQVIKQDTILDDQTFVLPLQSSTNSNENILLPENIQQSSSIQQPHRLADNIVEVLQVLLTEKILDDLFFIPVYQKVSQFNNYKKFQLQLTLDLQQSYSDFVSCHFFAKCSVCRRFPHINQEGYFMCLLCNSNFCAKHTVNSKIKQSHNNQQQQNLNEQQQQPTQQNHIHKYQQNTLIEHTQQHHSGMSMFLNYNSSQIVIIKDSEVFIERQLQLYKDRIGRPPNINRDWKTQVQICINTQKELQDLINKKDFDQKCMQIKRILFDQQIDHQQQQLRRELMSQENQQQQRNNQLQIPNQNVNQNRVRSRSNNNRHGGQQNRTALQQYNNSGQNHNSLSLNQQLDMVVDLNQQRRGNLRNTSSNTSTQVLNIPGAIPQMMNNNSNNSNNSNNNNNNNNINTNSNNNNNNYNNNHINNNNNNNQLYTNQQNFSSNVFTTLNF